jgi:hypothetical protein
LDTGPSGIGLDRAVVNRIEDDTAVLFVGPSSTAVHVETDALPEGAGPGTWVVMDLQSVPPLPLFIDTELTRSRNEG